MYGLRSAIFISDVRLSFLKSSTAKEISDMYGLCSAILFQMCVLRFLKSSRAKEISDMYGLCSAIFISDVRFAFFEMKQS